MNFTMNLTYLLLFKIMIFAVYLFAIVLIVLYNWLYISRTLQANKQIGLMPPDRIENLTKASIGIALLTAILIGFLLITRWY